MLVLKKEMQFEEFEQEFSYELRGLAYEATAIIYDSLCEMNWNGQEDTVDNVSDYIRFQVQVLSVGDVVNDYGYLMDGLDVEDLEAPETIEAITEFLNNYTHVLGTFEDEGITFFVFDEF